MFVYSYNQHSNSARELANELGAPRIKHHGSRFRGNPNKTVINWGSSSLPEEVMKCKVINDPVTVGICSNKLRFFSNVSTAAREFIPEWTTSVYIASEWLQSGHKVVARTVLTGHSGEGIVLLQPGDEVVDAPLYTKYIPKKDEYRLHIVRDPDDEAYYYFDAARKAVRSDFPEDQVNHQIRNHANGFVYRRNDITIPQCVITASYSVMETVGLDFGAVDVIYNKRQDRAYVLEINTAPGLEGSTVSAYANAILEHFGE